MATENSESAERPWRGQVDVRVKLDSDTEFFKDRSLLLIRIAIPNDRFNQGADSTILRETIFEAVGHALNSAGIV